MTKGAITPETLLSELTMGDLLALMRGEITVEPSTRETAEVALERSIAESNRAVAEEKQRRARALELIGASPPEIQVRLLKELAERPEEASRFMEDPIGYSREHGVLLDPAVVRGMVDTVLFGDQISAELAERLGPTAVKDILAMRGQGGVSTGGASMAAASSAASTVVTTAAALIVTALVTTLNDPAAVLDMKGLGLRGIKLPSGRILNTASNLAVIAAAFPGAVVIYGGSALTTGAVTARTRGGW